jgi:hypothetical protein
MVIYFIGMTIDGEVNYLPVPVTPKRAAARYAKASIVTVIAGSTSLLLAWVFVGSALVHRPVVRNLRLALYLTYQLAVWGTLISGAVCAIQLILYYNNRIPGKTPPLRGVAATCLGVALAVASYVIVVGMIFWIQGGRIVIMRR